MYAGKAPWWPRNFVFFTQKGSIHEVFTSWEFASWVVGDKYDSMHCLRKSTSGLQTHKCTKGSIYSIPHCTISRSFCAASKTPINHPCSHLIIGDNFNLASYSLCELDTGDGARGQSRWGSPDLCCQHHTRRLLGYICHFELVYPQTFTSSFVQTDRVLDLLLCTTAKQGSPHVQRPPQLQARENHLKTSHYLSGSLIPLRTWTSVLARFKDKNYMHNKRFSREFSWCYSTSTGFSNSPNTQYAGWNESPNSASKLLLTDFIRNPHDSRIRIILVSPDTLGF